MAKLLWYGFRYPGSLILVTVPKFDQVKNIAFKALGEHLHRIKARNPELFRATVGERGILKDIVRLRNGGQISAESPHARTSYGAIINYMKMI